jgi:hypothetical protein
MAYSRTVHDFKKAHYNTDSDSESDSESGSEDEYEADRPGRNATASKKQPLPTQSYTPPDAPSAPPQRGIGAGITKVGRVYPTVETLEPARRSRRSRSEKPVVYDAATEIAAFCGELGLSTSTWKSLAIALDEVRNGCYSITLPVSVAFNKSLNDLAVKADDATWVMDNDLRRLIGGKIAYSDATLDGETQVSRNQLLQRSSHVRFLIKSFEVKRTYGEFRFPVHMAINGLDTLVVTKHGTPGFPVLSTGMTERIGETFETPQWNAARKKLVSSKGLTASAINSSMFKVPASSSEDEHYMVRIDSDLFSFIQNNQEEFGFGAANLTRTKSVVDNKLKMELEPGNYILEKAFASQTNNGSVETLSATLLRADGNKWDDLENVLVSNKRNGITHTDSSALDVVYKTEVHGTVTLLAYIGI